MLPPRPSRTKLTLAVRAQTEAALKVGIDVILCIGENLEERETDKTVEVVTRQLAAAAKVIVDPAHWKLVVIAYEVRSFPFTPCSY